MMSVPHLDTVADCDTIRTHIRTKTMMALDPRHLGKPSCFDDTSDSSSSRTSQLLTHASETWLTMYLMLYAVIVECIKNRPLRLIMDTPSRDGREALRKLDAEHQSTYRGRQMALLRRIMHWKLNSAGSDAEYINKLSEWQQVVREYERISGSELDQTVKTATLTEEAPPQKQGHLRLRSEESGTD